jgi:transposase
LSQAQEAELEKVRSSHPKAYMRERASAVLKVANGQSVRQVAEHGLLKRHEPETVSQWIKRYQNEGLAGWTIKAGRGRKASFFPLPSLRTERGSRSQ